MRLNHVTKSLSVVLFRIVTKKKVLVGGSFSYVGVGCKKRAETLEVGARNCKSYYYPVDEMGLKLY